MPRQPQQRRSPQELADVRAAILSKLDIAAECTALGIVFSRDETSGTGWRDCFSIDRPEQRTSSAGINFASPECSVGSYQDFADASSKPTGFFDLAARLQPGKFGNFLDAIEHFAKQTETPFNRIPGRSAANTNGKSAGSSAAQLKFRAASLAPLYALQWSKAKQGTTAASVIAAGLRPAEWFGQSVSAFPAYDPADWSKPVTHVLYRHPNCQPFAATKKLNERKAHVVGGGKDGLIIIGTPEELAAAHTVWKCEGLPDACSLACRLPAGHIAVTNANGAKSFKPYFVPAFRGKKTILLYHADEAGEAGGQRAASMLIDEASELRWPRLPYRIDPKHGKDARDFFCEGRSIEELLSLADAAPILMPDDVKPAPPEASTNDDKPNEAADDPHRLARVFLELTGRRLVFWRAEFWQFDGRCYRKVTIEELAPSINAAIKAEYDRLNIIAQKIYNEKADKPDEPPPEARKVSRSIVNNVLAALEGMSLLSSAVEQNTWIENSETIAVGIRPWVSMANGILKIDNLLANLSEHEVLVQHSDHWFSPVSLPYKSDTEAECPTWNEFLSYSMEGDKQRIAILQEWAGYCLTSDTKFGKFLMLEGNGSNGKSTYFAAIEAMVGTENTSHVALERFHRPFDLTSTLGRRINIAADCAEIDKVAEGTLKPFVTGEAMHFDRKGIPGIECRPTARLLVGTNNRPRFSDPSDGIWRRMLLIPFLIKIEDGKKILGLDSPKWWENSGELPGIFNWAIGGLARLIKNQKFSDSTVSSSAMATYRSDSNPARHFIIENYQVSHPENWVLSSSIYQHYLDWCKENGHQFPKANNQFGMEIHRVFPSITKARHRDTEGRRIYQLQGIEMKIFDDEETEISQETYLF